MGLPLCSCRSSCKWLEFGAQWCFSPMAGWLFNQHFDWHTISQRNSTNLFTGCPPFRYKLVPPSYVCWFINTIHSCHGYLTYIYQPPTNYRIYRYITYISPINHSYWSDVHQLSVHELGHRLLWGSHLRDPTGRGRRTEVEMPFLRKLGMFIGFTTWSYWKSRGNSSDVNRNPVLW